MGLEFNEEMNWLCTKLSKKLDEELCLAVPLHVSFVPAHSYQTV